MAVFKGHQDEFASGKISRIATLGSLKISAYERTASGLLALVCLCGCITGCLFLMWLGHSSRFEVPKYALNVEGNGSGSDPAEFAGAPKSSGDLEVALPDEPASTELFQLTDEQSVAPSTVIDDAVTASIAEVGNVVAASVGSRRRTGFTSTNSLEESANVIPRWKRWEIQFASNSLADYAKQLDFFRIELGAMGGKKEIDYASNFSKSVADRRHGLPKDENRMYMTWRKGTLQDFDRQLTQHANINVTERFVVQFIPAETENILAALELRNARGLTVKEFYKTVFGVRRVGNGWEFFVVEQRFRTALDRL